MSDNQIRELFDTVPFFVDHRGSPLVTLHPLNEPL